MVDLDCLEGPVLRAPPDPSGALVTPECLERLECRDYPAKEAPQVMRAGLERLALVAKKECVAEVGRREVPALWVLLDSAVFQGRLAHEVWKAQLDQRVRQDNVESRVPLVHPEVPEFPELAEASESQVYACAFLAFFPLERIFDRLHERHLKLVSLRVNKFAKVACFSKLHVGLRCAISI